MLQLISIFYRFVCGGRKVAKIVKMIPMSNVYPIDQVVNLLCNNINAELICSVPQANNTAVMLCFEKYYFRNGSYASLSILITHNNFGQEITIVGHGGGNGLLNISWGANNSIAKKTVELLQNYGYSISYMN